MNFKIRCICLIIFLLFGVLACVNPISLSGKSSASLPLGARSKISTAEKHYSVPQSEPKHFVSLRVMCEINGHLVPAIIDTGAQVSVISKKRVRQCGIADSVDSTISGKLIGVGSTDIVGEIDALPITMGPLSFTSRIKVLENRGHVDFIIGLDFLRNFKGEVNLKENVLRLSIRDKVVRIPFLRDVEPFDSIDYSSHNVNEIQSDDAIDEMEYSPNESGSFRDLQETSPIVSHRRHRTGRLYGKPFMVPISGGHSYQHGEANCNEQVPMTSRLHSSVSEEIMDDADLSMEGI